MGQRIIDEIRVQWPDVDLAFLGSIGFNIRCRRIDSGMDLQDLAHKVGLTSFEVEMIEKGNFDLTLSDLHLIATSLNCTAYDLAMIPRGH